VGRDAADDELPIVGVEERHRRLNQHAAVPLPHPLKQLGLRHIRRAVNLAREHALALKGRVFHAVDHLGHDLVHLGSVPAAAAALEVRAL
jgi:hypothetical protein